MLETLNNVKNNITSYRPSFTLGLGLGLATASIAALILTKDGASDDVIPITKDDLMRMRDEDEALLFKTNYGNFLLHQTDI